jgi:SAM-dependent methyltransferase
MSEPICASVGLAWEVLDRLPRDIESLIDVGCGYGFLSYVVRAQYPKVRNLVGIELYRPYVERLSKQHVFDSILMHDLCRMPLPYADEEFDAAICVDVIEHLPKIDGLALLIEMERIAKRVVVTTPRIWGENEQSTADGNELQRHKSLWKPSDFRKRGYKVRGTQGNPLLPYAVIHFFPRLSWTFIAEKVSATGKNYSRAKSLRQL